jgi:hypothetical protein
MASNKNATLLKRILERTREGTIEWEATRLDETFQASFPNYSIRISRTHYEPEYPGDESIDYKLHIYNKEGKLIEEMYPADIGGDVGNPFRMLEETFRLARRTAFGVEEALDELISALGEGEDEADS